MFIKNNLQKTIHGIALAFLAAGVMSATGFAADVTVNVGDKLQKISGFGASSAWNNLNEKEEALLWDTLSGAGFSLHRLRIDETGLVSSTSNQGQLKIAKEAVKYGVTVWASPWSPVRSWQKKIGTDSKGGDELGFNFDYAEKWAKLLADYSRDMVKAGVPLFAISAQNEPDGRNFNHMTADEIVRWVRDYLGPAMEGTGVKIIAPETVNWYSFPSYKTAILKDEKASAYIPIIATHEYGGSPKAYPEIAQAGKEFWQTEIYEDLNKTDMGINSAVNTAVMMHEAIVIAGVNAWHYWWVHGPTGTSLFPNNSSTPAKRLWAMGNYSRFVRPGYYRVKATDAPASNVMVTAYKDTSNTRLVVVAINKNTSTVPLNIKIDGAAPISYVPYVTDDTQDLKAQSEATAGGNVAYTLPAKSVVSLVFKLTEPKQDPYKGVAAAVPGKLEFENYDEGGSGVSYSDTDSENKGKVYREDAVDIEAIDCASEVSATSSADDKCYALGYTIKDEWMEYTIDVENSAKLFWKARVATGSETAGFHMTIDGKPFGEDIVVENTGSWTDYKEITGEGSEVEKGEHILRVTIDQPYINLDWIEFGTSEFEITKPASSIAEGVSPETTDNEGNSQTSENNEIADNSENADVNTDALNGSRLGVKKFGTISYKVFDIQGNFKGTILNKKRMKNYPQGTYIIKTFADGKHIATSKWIQK